MTHDTTGGPLPQPCPGHRSPPDSGLAPTRLNAHLHKLGMTADPPLPLVPQNTPDTPEHLLLQCPATLPPHGTPPITISTPPPQTNSSRPLGWLSRPWLGLQKPQAHQDLPTESGQLQRI
ncbi:hypothetical protein GWK47_042437 [Chionoecetes opilio]|uniref:Uncharacterized protein n=1 Tax=Chionoecetes opilio TaxID=41210 RepID=A0A8J4YAF6_CHIOP|nr:hypothetical protein GWK47_042437 [Chionoecetes opilio]